jgi:ribosomal-protein-alanine N-acetyltransferase
VSLAPPRRADAAEFVAAVHASRALHRPWIYPPDDAVAYADYLARLRTSSHYGFLVRLRETGALVGVVNLNHVVEGVLQSASIAFYVFKSHARRGLMTEAVGRVLGHGFGKLGLHRIEANIQPDNGPSLALVRRLGFVKEGYSRRYLKIGGRWRDHERWALLAEDWRPRRGRDGLDGEDHPAGPSPKLTPMR